MMLLFSTIKFVKTLSTAASRTLICQRDNKPLKKCRLSINIRSIVHYTTLPRVDLVRLGRVLTTTVAHCIISSWLIKLVGTLQCIIK